MIVIITLQLSWVHSIHSQITWTNYNFSNTGGKLGSNQIYAIAVDPRDNGKTVWFEVRPNDNWGFLGGLVKFNTEFEDWTHFTKENTNNGLPNNRIWDIEFDSQGYMWIATHGGGLVKFDGESEWTVYNKSNSGLEFDTIYEIDIYSNGILWFGHGPEDEATAALSIFNGNDQWLVLTQSNSPFEANSCYAITFGQDGVKWLGQKTKRIFRFDDNGTPFDTTDDTCTHYTKDDGLGENTINAGSADTNINGDI